MQHLILTSIIISLAIVGLRIISSPGMILYFLRKPYDRLSDKMNKHNQALGRLNTQITKNMALKVLVENDKPAVLGNLGSDTPPEVLTGDRKENFIFKLEKAISTLRGELSVAKKTIGRTELFIYLLKPVIGCCTCMASFWTLVFIPLFISGPLGEYHIIMLPVIMLIVAAFNSLIYAAYEKLIYREKCPDCK
jgi:hypothetical protein